MAEPEFYSGKTLFPMIAALLALSALFGLVVMPRLAPEGGDFVRKPAPDFSLPLVANGAKGDRVRLSELKGNVVVLDFWATWCGPCRVQAPILDRIARRYPKKVTVLGVNVGESVAVARSYALAKGLSYPILSDPRGEAQCLYRADPLPTVVVIDPKGNVVQLSKGLVQQSRLERAIKSHL